MDIALLIVAVWAFLIGLALGAGLMKEACDKQRVKDSWSRRARGR